jgi:hypothetical protein
VNLHNDASKEGSDDRERRHRQQQPRPVQGFHPENTKPEVVSACPSKSRLPNSPTPTTKAHSTGPSGRRNIQGEAPRGKRRKNAELARPHVGSGVSPDEPGRSCKKHHLDDDFKKDVAPKGVTDIVPDRLPGQAFARR